MALLYCRDLCLGYEGREIVRDLNFEVNEQDYWAIFGQNGCGKSSLMRTILRLQAPLSGKIEFGDGLVQTDIGYLPQQAAIQRDFPASVEEIVLSGFQGRCGLRPFYKREEKLSADMNMDKMGILSLKKDCFRELSGGQQQRVLLARALCAARKMLLLDEPTTGLDPQASDAFFRLIEFLNQDGMTVVMITHDVESVKRYANRFLKFGKEGFTLDDSQEAGHVHI